jgi:hypothetical protein
LEKNRAEMNDETRLQAVARISSFLVAQRSASYFAEFFGGSSRRDDQETNADCGHAALLPFARSKRAAKWLSAAPA